jgi:hypothetical protein
VDNTPRVTCFAPTNEALASITQNGNLTSVQLSSLLSNHILFGTTAYSPTLIDGASFTTIAGTTITVSRRGDDIFVNGARILRTDVITFNGVCHVIDKVSKNFYIAGGREKSNRIIITETDLGESSTSSSQQPAHLQSTTASSQKSALLRSATAS